MYEAHFGLRELPFSLNPDPSFLHFGPNHSKALSILEFGLASESGITVITGEIGAGKTTLLRYLLNTMPTNRTVGLIATTHKAFGELIHWICMAFGLDHRNKDKVELYDQFYEYMIEEYGKGNRVVLIVDEAQNLDAETIEELRVISNINPGLDRLVVLPGSEPIANSSETLASPKMARLVNELKTRYPSRFVIFDLPPILSADDALAFSPHVDAALLVVEDGVTTKDDLARSVELLKQTELLGTVLNKTSERQTAYYYN